MNRQFFVKTQDNVQIALNNYCNDKDEVVIIAPGWCMTKDSKAFKQISEMFVPKFDVITFDFRGHGKSGGFYTFSAKENLDLQAVLDFAKNYKKIYLVGFSLGGAVVLIEAANNKRIHKVIAVSAPCDFDKIENFMWKKEAWGETFKKFELERFLSIRPGLIMHKKIRPIDVVDKIEVPTLFIAGKKDPTVYSWHTKQLCDKAICPKAFKLFENGFHAEDLYLHFKDEFSRICLEWLN